MNSEMKKHIKHIHHNYMQTSLSHSNFKNQANEKIINSNQFFNVEMKVNKKDSPLSLFSKRLQQGLKQKHKQFTRHLKDRRNSFMKDQELKIKQKKKILIIQQKINTKSGFSLKVIAEKSKERLLQNKSQKKNSFEKKPFERIPLISYPVQRMSGFRKKMIDYLQTEQVKNIDVFQKMNRRRSLQKRVKIQPFQGEVRMRIQTQPGNLGQVYFIIPSNLDESKKKIEKKITSIFQASRQYRAGSFQRFSKQISNQSELRSKQKQQFFNVIQKNEDEICNKKQGSISPWSQQISGQQF